MSDDDAPVCEAHDRNHRYYDPEKALVRIRPSNDLPSAAFVEPPHDPGFTVPAHRLAEFTRALYAAAGQPVPDLPVIYDPEMVEDLARTIAVSESPSDEVAEVHRMLARSVLGAGWRKQ